MKSPTTRWPLRHLVALALAVSGLLTLRASFERWWPTCVPGRYESNACQLIQDHRYDYIVPVEPWVPVGTPAEWQGAGLIVLAIAFVLLVSLVRVRSRWDHLLRVALAVLGCALAAVGGFMIAMGQAGRAWESAYFDWAQMFWLAGGPLVLVWAGWRAATESDSSAGARFAPYAFLLMTTPLMFLLPGRALVFSTSYDTPPWNEPVIGWFAAFAIAGVNPVRSGWRRLPEHHRFAVVRRLGLDQPAQEVTSRTGVRRPEWRGCQEPPALALGSGAAASRRSTRP